MCNSEGPSTSAAVVATEGVPQTIACNLGQLGPNDPQISDVVKTLRILSHASIRRKHSSSTCTPTSGHGSRCPNCNGMLTTSSVGGVRSRQEILKNLDELEKTLEGKGEKLPEWVRAYKSGDSLTAAKLLHLSFINRNKDKSRKRGIEVSPAKSTAEESMASKTCAKRPHLAEKPCNENKP